MKLFEATTFKAVSKEDETKKEKFDNNVGMGECRTCILFQTLIFAPASLVMRLHPRCDLQAFEKR